MLVKSLRPAKVNGTRPIGSTVPLETLMMIMHDAWTSIWTGKPNYQAILIVSLRQIGFDVSPLSSSVGSVERWRMTHPAALKSTLMTRGAIDSAAWLLNFQYSNNTYIDAYTRTLLTQSIHTLIIRVSVAIPDPVWASASTSTSESKSVVCCSHISSWISRLASWMGTQFNMVAGTGSRIETWSPTTCGPRTIIKKCADKSAPRSYHSKIKKCAKVMHSNRHHYYIVTFHVEFEKLKSAWGQRPATGDRRHETTGRTEPDLREPAANGFEWRDFIS